MRHRLFLVQLRCAKRLAFERKQRALRDAVRVGDRMASRRRRDTLCACLTAWRLLAARYQAVGAALQRKSLATLEGAFASWRQVPHHQVRDQLAEAHREAYSTLALNTIMV